MRVDDAPVVEILAVLRRLPPRDRMDVLALAVRAALDSGTLDAEPVKNSATAAVADAEV